jgi:hypothetical protein
MNSMYYFETTVFWVITPSSLAGDYIYFAGTCDSIYLELFSTPYLKKKPGWRTVSFGHI